MTAAPTRLRLDQALVARGLVPTRARARDLILRGLVIVDAQSASKPARLISAGDDVRIIATDVDYVSRGALKLAAALSHFHFEGQGRIGLDVGASTGGFTETLLAAGARKVYAVDNGRGQLHARLTGDARVVSLEGLDARRLDQTLIPEPVEALVADVSFISLAKALPAALAPGGQIIPAKREEQRAGLLARDHPAGEEIEDRRATLPGRDQGKRGWRGWRGRRGRRG